MYTRNIGKRTTYQVQFFVFVDLVREGQTIYAVSRNEKKFSEENDFFSLLTFFFCLQVGAAAKPVDEVEDSKGYDWREKQ